MSSISEKIEQHDSTQFLDFLEQFPDQIQNAWEISQRSPHPHIQPENAVVCGMGGSGISGELLQQFVHDRAEIPIHPNRFYELPQWVNSNTLVVLVSFSGNTEETLSCYEDARQRNAVCIAVTSNGELEKKAREDGETVINIPPNLPPRCAAGYLFVPLLILLSNVSDTPAPTEKDYKETCEKTLELTDEFSPDGEENRALEIARRLEGTLPIIYGSSPLTGVLAQRFKNQLNENAKMFATWNLIPELHHNEIMAWDYFNESPVQFNVFFLRDGAEHPRVQQRFEITREILKPNVNRIEEIQGRGDSRLARFFTLMLYTDYISYYLAILRGKDPVAIGPIEQLKQELAS